MHRMKSPCHSRCQKKRGSYTVFRMAMIISDATHFHRFGGSFLVSQIQRHFQECVTCFVNSLWPTAWNANSVSENCFVFNNIQKSRGQGSQQYVACKFVFTITESLCSLKWLTNFIKLNRLDFYFSYLHSRNKEK